MTHSNVFYILGEDGFHAEKNAITVPNKPGFDLFRIGFNISEGKTGRRILPHDTESQMLETIKRIDNDPEFQAKIENALAKVLQDEKNLSPRYTRPDEKYEVLFSPKAVVPKRPKGGKSKAAERQEDKVKYELAVANAEKAVYNKQAVVNTETKGIPIILCLFRENDISISRKTKDWIVSSLCSVQFDTGRHIWSFRHNGNLDPLFRSSFDQLCIALMRKHGGIQLKGVSSEGG